MSERIKKMALRYCVGIIDHDGRLIGKITSIIIESENEALERAAQLCDAASSGDGGDVAADLAAQIRALKCVKK